MTIQDFCQQYGFNPTRATRLAREAVVKQAVAGQVLTPAQLRSRAINVNFPQYGFRASKGRGHKRLRYEVHTPSQFRASVLRSSEYADLSPSQIESLIGAATTAWQLYHGRHKEAQLVDRKTRVAIKPNEKYWEQVARTLRRVGAL
jgi:hypothetical protein